jgi:hypothetical protein
LADASVHILVRVEVLRSRDGNCRDPASNPRGLADKE